MEIVSLLSNSVTLSILILAIVYLVFTIYKKKIENNTMLEFGASTLLILTTFFNLDKIPSELGSALVIAITYAFSNISELVHLFRTGETFKTKQVKENERLSVENKKQKDQILNKDSKLRILKKNKKSISVP